MRRPIALTAASLLTVGSLSAATASPNVLGEATPSVPQVRAVIPPIRMDTTALRIATAPGGSAFSTLGGIPVRVHPEAVTLSPRPPLDDAGLTGLLERTGVEILWGTGDCTHARWIVKAGGFDGKHTARPNHVNQKAYEALPPGHERHLCTRLAPKVSQDDLVQKYAGRRVLASVQWVSESEPPATWNSGGATNALLTVPLPPAQPAPQACSAARSGVTVRWTWPSAKAKPTEAGAIDHWTVNARPAGSTQPWKRVALRSEGGTRAVTLGGAELRAAGATGAQELMVRAYPFESEDVHVDSAKVWKVTVPARGGATCNSTAANSGRLLELGDDR